MGYAGILVHVQTNKDAKPRLECACALAKTFDATLIGVGAEIFPLLAPDYGYYAMQAEWYGLMRKSVDENLLRARVVFDAAAQGRAKATVWESGLRVPIEAVAEASRGADLIVVGATNARRQNTFEDVPTGELIITAGRPVLVTPARGRPLVGDKVVLAWKDSREARRAMSDALPFFQRALSVMVLELCGKDDVADAELRTKDVVAALTRHGVVAVPKVVVGPGEARQIAREADAFGADLIVAGGYGHSRLGEWVFGGVTRDLLKQDARYVLLSH